MDIATAPPTGAYKGTRDQDAKTFRKEIASYGPKTEFFNNIWKACDFQKVALRPAVNFVDGMCGPGRLGLDLRERVREAMPDKFLHFAFYFNDVKNEPLMKLAETALIAPCDIRDLGQRFPLAFHVAAVRYGIKDLPKNEQKKALVALRESLVPGGRLVIADMTAYNARQQEGIIKVHSMEQMLAGRNPKAEGTCHVPTTQEWEALLSNAGFQNVAIPFTGTSDETTSQWADQFGSDELKIRVMNNIIHDTAAMNSEFQKGCEVTFRHMEASLKFPIMVMTGDKP